jgi:hypothetical protein
MSIYVKLTEALLCDMKADLARMHPFAHERVGFITAGADFSLQGDLTLFCRHYFPVADENYEHSHRVGAQIGSEAMRKAAEIAYNTRSTLLHVHMHEGRGRPEFSKTDAESGFQFVPGFFNVQPKMPHGLVVLNESGARGLLWTSKNSNPFYVSDFIKVGTQITRIGGK